MRFPTAVGRDPSIVGRRIRVNRAPLTVVGVMGRDFRPSFARDASVPDDMASRCM